MTADLPDKPSLGTQLFDQVVAVIASVVGEGAGWAAAVLGSARLEADLRLDSIEVAALGQALAGRFGERVDLPGFLAELSFDRLVELTVADLVGYVAACREEQVASAERVSR
jgi:acyl carrier protein